MTITEKFLYTLTYDYLFYFLLMFFKDCLTLGFANDVIIFEKLISRGMGFILGLKGYILKPCFVTVTEQPE